jgi:hypothetical protein
MRWVGFLVAQDFYEDLFEELSKYGELESLNVCDNLADHMVFERCPNVVLNCSINEDASVWILLLLSSIFLSSPDGSETLHLCTKGQ